MKFKEREKFEKYIKLLELKKKKDSLKLTLPKEKIDLIDNKIFDLLIDIVTSSNFELIPEKFIEFDFEDSKLLTQLVNGFEIKKNIYSNIESYSCVTNWYLKCYEKAVSEEDKELYWDRYQKSLEQKEVWQVQSLDKIKEEESNIVELLKVALVSGELDKVVNLFLLNINLKVKFSKTTKSFHYLYNNNLIKISKQDFLDLVLSYSSLEDNSSLLDKELAKDDFYIKIPIIEIDNNIDLKMLVMYSIGYGKGKTKRVIENDKKKIKRRCEICQ